MDNNSKKKPELLVFKKIILKHQIFKVQYTYIQYIYIYLNSYRIDIKNHMSFCSCSNRNILRLRQVCC